MLLPLNELRNTRPTTPDHLHDWVLAYTGVSLPREPVCAGHTAPFTLFSRQFFDRPPLALWHGPRGSGKSFMSALDTHCNSRFIPRHATRILGGSKAQSEQIYQAINEAILDGSGTVGSDRSTIHTFNSETARYRNGSTIKMLAASDTSVRGPHVPSLKLDEVDEIDPDIRESAMGMAMRIRGIPASVLMTSTWHRVGGPMAELMERGLAGAFPVDTFCVFEVLERCPTERSGPNLEHCGGCAIKEWCHSDMAGPGKGVPKAKRSNGHYAIDSLIQKAKAVSRRVFESDYLCGRPKASGVWYGTFDEAKHVKVTADYNPSLPFHVSLDSGVHSGGVWFQTRPRVDGRGFYVNVFADYFAEGLGAEKVATQVLEQTRRFCGETYRRRISTDPAGDNRTPMGVTVRGEYERAGLKGTNGLESWPTKGRKIDGLLLIEAMLMSADGTVSLTIHPRCKHLILAFQCYARAKRNNQWMDYPEDPQHPHEDLIDPLAGGLKLEFPDGRAQAPALRKVSARGLM